MAGPDWTASTWTKSRHSGDTGGCVEWARRDDLVAVRDSKDPAGSVLAFDLPAWRAFVAAVCTGGLGTEALADM